MSAPRLQELAGTASRTRGALAALLPLAAPPAALASEEGGGGGGLLDVDPGLIVWTVVTFFIVLVVLRLVAWKPVLQAVEARERAIQEAIEQARRDREEAERLLGENRRRLDEARRKTADIVAEGQKDAERLVEQAKASARKEAERILDESRRRLAQETRAAMAAVRGTVADLAITAAGKLLGKAMDEPAHRGLVDEYLKELEARAASPRDSRPS